MANIKKKKKKVLEFDQVIQLDVDKRKDVFNILVVSGESEIERIENFHYGNKINFVPQNHRINGVVMVKVFNAARPSWGKRKGSDERKEKMKPKMKTNAAVAAAAIRMNGGDSQRES